MYLIQKFEKNISKRLNNNMTNAFDKLCETIMSNTQQQKPAPNAQGTPQPTPAPQQNQQQAPQQNQQQAPQQNQQQSQMKDDDLLNLLQQKMNDQKFRDQFMKMLNQNQQNASTKPA
jgi:hypothetical protein